MWKILTFYKYEKINLSDIIFICVKYCNRNKLSSTSCKELEVMINSEYNDFALIQHSVVEYPLVCHSQSLF